MILFDGHAHIYDCFDLDVFVRAAFRNFTEAAGRIQGSREQLTGFIFLTESAGLNYFAYFQTLAGEDGEYQWRVTRSQCGSLVISHPEWMALSLVLVHGRQLVTEERLELLALFCDRDLDDGMDLDTAAIAVREAGGIPVCPWGTGKWLGKRGKRLAESLSCRDENGLFLGDSGVRPSIWPFPSRLQSSGKEKTALLSGTDPLPVSGEEKRVGSFGGCLPHEGIKNMDKPAHELKKLLLHRNCQVVPFGRSQHICTFLKNQLMLRVNRKHR
ncbi:hypothetical protein [Desulfomarina sp.]